MAGGGGVGMEGGCGPLRRSQEEPPELDWTDERTIRYGLILRSDKEGGHLAPAAAVRARQLLGRGMRCDESQAVAGEEALLRALVGAVQRHDPDMLLAWDVRRASLGYAIERATVLGLTPPLVRAQPEPPPPLHSFLASPHPYS